MSHNDESMEWTTEPRELGWFARLVAPQGGGRPATAAFAIGIGGAAAFVASLALDWQSATVPPPAERTFDPTTTAQSFSDNIANVFMLGLVYAAGGVVLLGLLGAVVTRSELALRLRMTAAGVTVGLIGVLVAATIRMPEYLLGQAGIDPGSPAAAGITTSYEPGMFCAYAAVVLPMIAIWFAARPAARAVHAAAAATDGASASTRDGTTRAEARHAADHTGAPALPEVRQPTVRGDGYRGLSVSSSEPLDLSVSRDAWPR